VTINERSNRSHGYTVTLWSANANSGSTFKLRGSTTSDTINYTMKYDGDQVNLVNGQAVVTDANRKTSIFGVNKVMSISIPSGFPAADTYSDTITIILADK
jgi:spore coat protein U-like protein